ncbi:MAG: hypothetical protein JXA24_02635, partial [Proteobacteria bacterium]|nr:hypothetical protein [Pseudomonadota bacterium]
MAMKTDFKKGSRTWALWNDMIALAKEEGVPANRLERAVDGGFHTGFSLINPEITNKKGVIERSEVFQHAYGDKRYYPLLARHRFPVPFAMDDFAGEGGFDDGVRADIAAEIERMGKAIAAGEDAPAPGSDAHRRAMALGLCEYLRPMFRRARDCKFERVDWDAIKGRCGMCTELGFASFYAFREAGLDPRFLFVNDFDPTLGALGAMFSNEDNGTFHILVGVPMSDGSMLQIDPQVAGFEVRYAHAKEGPAWFGALAYLSNYGNSDVSEKRRKEAVDAAAEMAPREWIFDEMRLRAMVRDISSADLKAELDAMRRRNPKSPEIDA